MALLSVEDFSLIVLMPLRRLTRRETFVSKLVGGGGKGCWLVMASKEVRRMIR